MARQHRLAVVSLTTNVFLCLGGVKVDLRHHSEWWKWSFVDVVVDDCGMSGTERVGTSGRVKSWDWRLQDSSCVTVGDANTMTGPGTVKGDLSMVPMLPKTVKYNGFCWFNDGKHLSGVGRSTVSLPSTWSTFCLLSW